MLHPVSRENLQAAIVQLNRYMDRKLLGRSTEHFTKTFVKVQSRGSLVKARRRGKPWIAFIGSGDGRR
jgi:hypothetical protein